LGLHPPCWRALQAIPFARAAQRQSAVHVVRYTQGFGHLSSQLPALNSDWPEAIPPAEVTDSPRIRYISARNGIGRRHTIFETVIRVKANK